ncbi:MAG TPA: AarF/UbiB family protein, partial [Pyrinomonadaceae bacterium]
MTTNQALVKRDQSNGNGLAVTEQPAPKQATQVPPLTEAMVDEILKGRDLRGWLRAARVARVLGLFSLYLFLDTYDIRADFNNRAVARKQELARGQGRKARLKAWVSGQVYIALDRFIRALRYVVFRGAEGSANKQARLEQQALWLRQSLIDLGPTFIKIGQALGTRADLLPLEYVKELAKLQDQVPAFPTAEAFAIVEAELGRSLHESYKEIDSEPIAAASLGQVYRARLHTGEEVAVKVQRPNLQSIISFDVAILFRLVKLTNRFFPKANENADWEGMLREFHATIFEEMDYVREGRNADRFRYNFRTWRAIR